MKMVLKMISFLQNQSSQPSVHPGQNADLIRIARAKRFALITDALTLVDHVHASKINFAASSIALLCAPSFVSVHRTVS